MTLHREKWRSEPTESGYAILVGGQLRLANVLNNEGREPETPVIARLMSAAPELLASLVELLEPLEAASAAMVAGGMALDLNGEAAFDRARKAIDKATATRPLAPTRDRG